MQYFICTNIHKQVQQKQTVTFQIILVSMSNSHETYALLVYKNVNWTMSSGERVFVGFNEGECIEKNCTIIIFGESRYTLSATRNVMITACINSTLSSSCEYIAGLHKV